MKVITLIASATEMVCALGAEALLVGRSQECDYPETIKNLPSCTEIKFNPGLSSYQIDERIRGILQEGLSVYRVHADILKRLKPDVIVTQIQCQVCAVSENDVKEAVAKWLEPGSRTQVKIVAMNPNSLSDIWNDLRQIARALQIEGKGEQVIADLKSRLEAIFTRANSASGKPRVACVEWIDPLMAAGNWNPELVELAYGENILGEAGKHSPYMSFESLAQSDPDIIVVSPCGFDIARTKQELPILTNKAQWRALRAVKEGKVFLADGNQYFNRPGPRLVEATRILAEILHPDLFEPTFLDQGWEPLS